MQQRTCEELIGEHPEAPDIDRLRVLRATHQDLGRGVLGGPAHGSPPVQGGARVHRPAKVRQLQPALAVQEKVLGLTDRPVDGLIHVYSK